MVIASKLDGSKLSGSELSASTIAAEVSISWLTTEPDSVARPSETVSTGLSMRLSADSPTTIELWPFSDKSAQPDSRGTVKSTVLKIIT